MSESRLRPVTWSPTAIDLVMAMRQRQTPHEAITTGDAIYAWTQVPPPGASALGRALRDQSIWPNYMMVLDGLISHKAWPATQIYRQVGLWVWESEQRARNDSSFRVGERHILEQISEKEWTELGVDLHKLRAVVRELEIGPGLPLEKLVKYKHGLLDASALIECRRPDEIPWVDALEGHPVMLWLVASVLNELDDIKRSDRRRARKRAHARSSWIWSLLDEALADLGVEIRKQDSTRLKAWLPSGSGLRDTDHLEAALNLRALGLDLAIVTDDIGMSARAKLAGLRVVRLDYWRLPDAEEDTTAP